jgi:hypothetical protein
MLKYITRIELNNYNRENIKWVTLPAGNVFLYKKEIIQCNIMYRIFQNTALTDFKAVWNDTKTKRSVQVTL